MLAGQAFLNAGDDPDLTAAKGAGLDIDKVN